MAKKTRRPLVAAERPSISTASTTFGILEEWSEGLAAAALQADRGALAHVSFVEAYWEARGAA